jgi:excisionase family DNA binding protein
MASARSTSSAADVDSNTRFLEVAHVAHRLHLSQSRVRQLIVRRTLRAFRFGTRYRVDPIDLQAYIDARAGKE